MYVRSKTGQIIKVDINKFPSEKNLYVYLWKLKYNINLKEKNISIKDSIINYINNDIDFV